MENKIKLIHKQDVWLNSLKTHIIVKLKQDDIPEVSCMVSFYDDFPPKTILEEIDKMKMTSLDYRDMRYQ